MIFRLFLGRVGHQQATFFLKFRVFIIVGQFLYREQGASASSRNLRFESFFEVTLVDGLPWAWSTLEPLQPIFARNPTVRLEWGHVNSIDLWTSDLETVSRNHRTFVFDSSNLWQWLWRGQIFGHAGFSGSFKWWFLASYSSYRSHRPKRSWHLLR